MQLYPEWGDGERIEALFASPACDEELSESSDVLVFWKKAIAWSCLGYKCPNKEGELLSGENVSLSISVAQLTNRFQYKGTLPSEERVKQIVVTIRQISITLKMYMIQTGALRREHSIVQDAKN